MRPIIQSLCKIPCQFLHGPTIHNIDCSSFKGATHSNLLVLASNVLAIYGVCSAKESGYVAGRSGHPRHVARLRRGLCSVGDLNFCGSQLHALKVSRASL